MAPGRESEPISPLNGNTLTQQESTQRTILRYWRQQGVDVTTEELATNDNPDPFYGIRPTSLHTHPESNIPPYLCAGVTPLYWFEAATKTTDPPSWTNIRGIVGENFAAWYYKNNISAEVGTELHDDGAGNTFYPALWKTQTIIAYSKNGYTTPMTWTMPPGFGGVTAVDLYDVTELGYTKLQTVTIASQAISFTMTANQEIVIVPMGTVPASAIAVSLGAVRRAPP